jgi:hypothetical protein
LNNRCMVAMIGDGINDAPVSVTAINSVLDRVDTQLRHLPQPIRLLRSDQEAMSRFPARRSYLFRQISVALLPSWIYRQPCLGG